VQHPQTKNLSTLYINNSINMHPIELAIDDLNLQEVPRVRATVKQYGVDPSTLSQHWRGKTRSREDY
jgi:hypothetical protein